MWRQSCVLAPARPIRRRSSRSEAIEHLAERHRELSHESGESESSLHFFMRGADDTFAGRPRSLSRLSFRLPRRPAALGRPFALEKLLLIAAVRVHDIERTALLTRSRVLKG